MRDCKTTAPKLEEGNPHPHPEAPAKHEGEGNVTDRLFLLKYEDDVGFDYTNNCLTHTEASPI